MDHLKELLSRYPQLTDCGDDIMKAFYILAATYKNKKKVLVCGNGGSASDSEHIVGELMKGFRKKRPIDPADRAKINNISGMHGQFISDHLQGALPTISLVSHSALMTAFANDVHPNMVFAQQVYGYGTKGDTLIGLSTSGQSQNVIYAMIVAKTLDMNAIAFTGKDGGELKNLADVAIRVPSAITHEIQEGHLAIYHTICMMIEDEFFKK